MCLIILQSAPGYREGRSGRRRRTCVHTVDRQNTRGGKHLLALASPSQRQGSPVIIEKDKLKARNLISLYLSTSSTVAGGAKKPEVVALAQQQVTLRVQRLTNLEKHSLEEQSEN